jgi:hypothetical protein
LSDDEIARKLRKQEEEEKKEEESQSVINQNIYSHFFHFTLLFEKIIGGHLVS